MNNASKRQLEQQRNDDLQVFNQDVMAVNEWMNESCWVIKSSRQFKVQFNFDYLTIQLCPSTTQWHNGDSKKFNVSSQTLTFQASHDVTNDILNVTFSVLDNLKVFFNRLFLCSYFKSLLFTSFLRNLLNNEEINVSLQCLCVDLTITVPLPVAQLFTWVQLQSKWVTHCIGDCTPLSNCVFLYLLLLL